MRARASLLLLAVFLAGPAISAPGQGAKDQDVMESFVDADQLLAQNLRAAVRKGDLEAVNALLKKGAKTDAADRQGTTPLMVAIAARRPEIVRVLIEAGADLNAKDRRGVTALFMAASWGDLDTARLLIEKGVDLKSAMKCDEDECPGHTALSCAAEQGQAEMVRLLISKGADIRQNDGVALKRAIREGYSEICEILNEGVGGSAAGLQVPLLLAVADSNFDKVQHLLAKGADVNDRRESPLYNAVGNKNAEMVKLLISKGADPNLPTPARSTFIADAILRGWTDGVLILLESKADPNAVVDPTGQCALHLAVEKNAPDVVRLLLDHGARVDFEDKKGVTPLLKAENGKRTEIIEMLKKADAKAVDPARIDQSNVPFEAVYDGDIERLKRLVAEGTKPDAVNGHGDTLLGAAIWCAYGAADATKPRAGDVLKYVLTLEVDVNRPSGPAKLTPLAGVLSMSRDPNVHEVVATLLQRGAKPDVANPRGKTPLMLAAEKGNAAVVRLLLKAGADVAAKSPEGETALSIALKANRGEIAAALKEAGAKE